MQKGACPYFAFGGFLRKRWDRTDWLVLLGLFALAILAWSRVLFVKQWSFGIETDFHKAVLPGARLRG
jgi:hypothetical protein